MEKESTCVLIEEEKIAEYNVEVMGPNGLDCNNIIGHFIETENY